MTIRRARTLVRPLAGLCLCALALLALRGAALAVPAHPRLVQADQPDGTKVLVTMKGDEFHHWHEDAAGYTVMKDKASRAWTYAEQDASGALRPGPHRVGAADPAALGLKKALRDSRKAAAGLARRVKAEAARRARASSAPSRVSSSVPSAAAAAGAPARVQTPILSGTMKNLVILARFSDQTQVFTQAQFNSLFNTAGYNYDGARGSVKDYFLEISYGGIAVDSVVTAWVTLPNTAAYYGANDAQGWDLRPREMVFDALTILNNAGFNFAQCDANADGWVDGLTVIHSGRSEEWGGSANYVWSHQWELASEFNTWDGKKMQMYHTEGELRGNDSYPASIMRIGTTCHEMGHFLGLPDLYDTNGGSSGLGEFCLMSGGSWTGPNYEGESPAHMSAWPKKYLGWASPTQLTTVGTKTLARSAVDPSAMYLLRDSAFPSGEYFLLENRTAYGFDSYTPGTYRGMLIWHVDENAADNTNPAHYLVDLEEASGTQHLTAGEGVYGDDNDYYRLGNNNFGDSTTPNSRTYNASLPLKLIVNSVSSQGSSMNFYLASTDGTPPSAPAVSDGLGTDIDKTGSTSQLSANWTASADAETGITGYYYAIGTSVGGTDVSGWTGTGTTRSVTRSGLSLVNGTTYYFGVKAVNGVGVESSVAWSDGQWVDLNSPADVPYVNDGTAAELDFVSSRSRLSAYWGQSPSEGITAYYYAIGTTPGGVDARNWTPVGLQLSTAAVGLNLAEGSTYYFSVKARNASGFESSPVSSDGQLVDVTSPTARVLYSAGTVLRPGAFSAKLVVAEANGVAGAPALQLKTSAGVPVPLTLAYLTGSTWTVTANLETYHSSGTAAFTFSASDPAGNTGAALTGASFTLDTSVSGVAGGIISNTDGMRVTVPAGAYSGNLFISISTVAASRTDPADAASPASNELLAYDLAREFRAVNSAGAPVTVFASPLTLTLAYPDANDDGRIDGDLARESLAWIYYLDEALGKWTPLEGVARDADANTLTVQVPHFSVYSVRTAPGAEAGMDGLKAYPNPFDLRTASSLVIAGIPADAAGARVYIYNSAAELVRTLAPGDGIDALNTASWDGRLKNGSRAATGLYMYLVTTSNYGKGKGKFFLVW